MNIKSFTKYLATGEYVPTADAAPIDLAAHDRRFHPNGYKEGDRCDVRASLASGDVSDVALAKAEQNECAKSDGAQIINFLPPNAKEEMRPIFSDEGKAFMKKAVSAYAKAKDSDINDLWVRFSGELDGIDAIPDDEKDDIEENLHYLAGILAIRDFPYRK